MKNEGYIVQPYFDGKPAVLRNTDDDGDVLLFPRYNNVKVPPKFMYHLIDEEFSYRVDVMYIDEQFISAAQSNGYLGVCSARDEQTLDEIKGDSTITHYVLTIDGSERNVTVITYTDGQSYGEFVWDKYLIRVRGDLLTANDSYTNINLDLLPHLSFEKMPLNPTASTASGESSAPQPSQSLPDEGNSTEAPISPTQSPAE